MRTEHNLLSIWVVSSTKKTLLSFMSSTQWLVSTNASVIRCATLSILLFIRKTKDIVANCCRQTSTDILITLRKTSPTSIIVLWYVRSNYCVFMTLSWLWFTYACIFIAVSFLVLITNNAFFTKTFRKR